MNEEIQKAIELLEKSEHIAILIPSQPVLDSVASAEVLTTILEAREKPTGFLAKSQEKNPLPAEFFPRVLAASPLPKEFIISLDTLQSPVSQLRYEKQETRVDVILSPKSSKIREGFVSFREGKLLCDCILALGIADIEDTADISQIPPEFFTEHPIINIDNSEDNKHYGEINLVDAKKSSLAEIVYPLATALGQQPLGKDHSTLLLAGILHQTQGFRSPATNADTLLAASELLRLGAKHGHALQLVQESQPIHLLQFLGRIVVRSKIQTTTSDKPGVLWSFATAEDFDKTGRKPDDILLVMRYLESTFPRTRATALLWQDPQEKTSIRALLSASPEVLQAIHAREPGELNTPYLKPGAVFTTFQEAEERISALLNEVL